jgi:hypothetical protein
VKKIFSLFAFALLALTSCENERLVEENSLPPQAREFIEAHFPDATIVRVVRDRDDLLTSYDVVLSNQVELEFDKNGECYSVDGNRDQPIPDSVIPMNVLDYIRTNYPNAFIREWEKSKTIQEVKLSTREELVFNLAGTFLRLDD